MSFEKVMVALDYKEPRKAYALVDEIGDKIDWFKIGPVLFTQSGKEVVDFLHRRGKSIFLDLKLYDIPQVVYDTVKQFGELGVRMATVHCVGGHRMLEAANRACRGTEIQLLGVTLLTSHGTAESRDTGWGAGEDPLTTATRLTDLALESRLSGVLTSPHEVQRAKEKALPGFLCVTPGIRIPGQEVYQDDQQRVASPKEALEWGADYVIVGRPITQAREPGEVLNRLFR